MCKEFSIVRKLIKAESYCNNKWEKMFIIQDKMKMMERVKIWDYSDMFEKDGHFTCTSLSRIIIFEWQTLQVQFLINS